MALSCRTGATPHLDFVKRKTTGDTVPCSWGFPLDSLIAEILEVAGVFNAANYCWLCRVTLNIGKSPRA